MVIHFSHVMFWIFTGCILWSAFVITSAYRGNVLSFLTITIQPDPPDTITDLIQYPIDITSTFDFFTRKLDDSESSSELSSKIRPKMVSFFDVRSQLSELIASGQLAMIDSHSAELYRIRNEFLDRQVSSAQTAKDCIRHWLFHPQLWQDSDSHHQRMLAISSHSLDSAQKESVHQAHK